MMPFGTRRQGWTALVTAFPRRLFVAGSLLGNRAWPIRHYLYIHPGIPGVNEQPGMSTLSPSVNAVP